MDDPDQLVADHVESEILKKGVVLIPELEGLLENALDDPQKSERINRLLKRIRFDHTLEALNDWKFSQDKSLIEGLYIVCKYQFPELAQAQFMQHFSKLKEAVWLEVNPKQTSFEIVKIMNKVFYDHFDFKKSSTFPVSPFDLYVNAVFESREGTDLALGLIYSLVAQSLDLPIYGVIPQRGSGPFMLAYLDENNLLNWLDWGVDNNGVLFYISISNKGVIVEPRRLKEAYALKGMDHVRSCFEPTPNTVLIKNYLTEIRKSCENNIQFRYKIDELNQLINLF